MLCEICGLKDSIRMWEKEDRENPAVGEWYRCMGCGSDISPTKYDDVKSGYVYTSHPGLDLNGAIAAMRANLDWFDHYIPSNKDFLDIGYLEGASLKGMSDKGYRSWGFEVNKACYLGNHTKIADEFYADLFPITFGGIMCREVIEHVPNWRRLLAQIHKALSPKGIFQCQTPKPSKYFHLHLYHKFHLRIFSPYVFQRELERAGFEILEYRQWTEIQPGQAAICRRTDSV